MGKAYDSDNSGGGSGSDSEDDFLKRLENDFLNGSDDSDDSLNQILNKERSKGNVSKEKSSKSLTKEPSKKGFAKETSSGNMAINTKFEEYSPNPTTVATSTSSRSVNTTSNVTPDTRRPPPSHESKEAELLDTLSPLRETISKPSAVDDSNRQQLTETKAEIIHGRVGEDFSMAAKFNIMPLPPNRRIPDWRYRCNLCAALLIGPEIDIFLNCCCVDWLYAPLQVAQLCVFIPCNTLINCWNVPLLCWYYTPGKPADRYLDSAVRCRPERSEMVLLSVEHALLAMHDDIADLKCCGKGKKEKNDGGWCCCFKMKKSKIVNQTDTPSK